MSGYGITYSPPSENLPIFDTSVFVDPNTETLTIAEGLNYFLAYPNAQGTENLLGINVAGPATFTDDIIVTNGTNTTTLNVTAQSNLLFTSSIAGGGIEITDPNTTNVVLSSSDYGLVVNKAISVSNASNANSVILQADKITANQLNILGSTVDTSGNLYVSGIATMGTEISTANSNNTTLATTAFVTNAISNISPGNYAELSNTTSQTFTGDNVFSLYPTITASLPVSTTSDNQIATTAFVQSVVSSISPVTPVTGQAYLADSTDSTAPQTFTGYNQFNQNLYLQGILQYNNVSTGGNFTISNTNTQGQIILNSNGQSMITASRNIIDFQTSDTASSLLNTSGFSATGLTIKGNFGLNIGSYGNGLKDSGNWGFNPVWSATETVYPPHFNFVSPNISTSKPPSGTYSPQYNFYSWNGTSQVLALAVNAGGIQYTAAAQSSSITPNVSTTQINANGDYELSVTTVDDFGGDVVINGTSWRLTLGDLSQAKQDLETAKQNITELQVKMNYLYQTFFHQ